MARLGEESNNYSRTFSASARELILASSLYDGLEDGSIIDLKTILQKSDANPNVVLPKQGIAPFHLAVGNESEYFAEEVTRLFLQYGGNPNVRSLDNQTPVHIAAAWGRSDILRLLLLNGGDPWIYDSDNNNALYYAFKGEHWNVVTLLHTHQATERVKEDNSVEDKYTLSLEKVFVYNKDVAYEYSSDPEGCTPNMRSVATQMNILFAENDQKSAQSENLKKEMTGVRTVQLCSKPISRDSDEGISVKENDLVQLILKNSNQSTVLDSINKKGDSACEDSKESIPEPQLVGNMECDGKSHYCETNSHKRLWKLIADEYSAKDVLSLAKIPVVRNDLIVLNKTCSSDGDLVNENQTKEVKTESCTINSRYTSDRFSLLDLSLELICNDEWIASQSCFLFCESNDFFTCSDDDDNTNNEENKLFLCGGNCSRNVSITSSAQSFVSLSEEYKYSDEEEGVVFFERRFLVPLLNVSDLQWENVENKVDNPSNPDSKLQYEKIECKAENPVSSYPKSESGKAECKVEDLSSSDPKSHSEEGDSLLTSDISVPSSLDYATDVLREKLIESGFIPGPITATTKRLYLRKLFRLQRNPKSISLKTKAYSPELQRTLSSFKWESRLPVYLSLEKEIAQQFSQPDPTRRWREGIVKSSFTYLLLDPRVSDNLPCRVDSLSHSQIWSTFLSSIFYVGKGKRTRPYSHLYRAFDVWNKKTVERLDKKIHYILDIWKAGLGVVCLHVFQNIIPVEAYTREAAMIDAIGLKNLKNVRCGDYYGVAVTWTSHQRRMLGTYLLYRAMCIFLNEGERQLRPGDIG